MAGQNQTDLFDSYFRRADLDQDGRISGAEAVAFFQGSNLPQQVLAQVWMHADQYKIGFLGRAEFYNALKLVTVAQRKLELTPDIVKAALYGPNSAKIPAPQINIAATPAPRSNPTVGTPVSQLSGATPVPSHNVAVRGPQVSASASMGQQFFPSQQNHLGKPPLPTSPATAFRPQQGVSSQGMSGVGSFAASPSNTNISSDWLVGSTGDPPAGVATQVPNRGITPSTTRDEFGLAAPGMTASPQPRPHATTGLVQPAAPKPHDPTLPSSRVEAKDSKPNGFASDSVFGDVFSVTSSQPKQDSPVPASSASDLPASSAAFPASTGPQATVKPSPLGSLQSAFSQQSVGSQPVQSTVKVNQKVAVQSSTTFSSSSAGFPVGAGNSASGQSQAPWPRMTQSDVQKYTKVFVEVDTDRDGKISGEQARNLFLSWRLPREVLKQVWDLSDQDNDSMLSLREFCIALYLMERYREGRLLPKTLPSSIMYDGTLSPASGQPAASYGNSTWRPTPGLQQAQMMPGVQPTSTAARARTPNQVSITSDAKAMQPPQQKSKVPVLEQHLLNQLSEEEQNLLNSKFQEATEANKKVEELEKENIESREKIEFYHSKMQELILYKSRCDNRLNEITERTSVEKREAESLAKKYEEKYKQSGDVASKLSIEEATFRDIQEKKMELYRAIVKMEQDGKADGVQVNAVRIQSELEELVKSLNERCKSYGLRAKPTTLVELPFGWQPGIQEGAADWDEIWDKFEDEGFTFVKELTLDVQNVIAPPKAKSSTVQNIASSTDEGVHVSSANADTKSETLLSVGEKISDDVHNEEGVPRIPPESPAHTSESPSNKFENSPSRKNLSSDGSPIASEHGDAESMLFGDKSFDEPSLGIFGTHYDSDSVWDFSSGPIKEMDYNKHGDISFFDSGDLGLPPIRTDSSHRDVYQRKSPFAFDDSVPSTPVYYSGNSPQADNMLQKNTFVFDSVPSTPQADNTFQKKSTYVFDSVPSTPQSDNLFQQKSTLAFDSVPSTPMYNYSNSPRRFSGGSEEHTFENFSRFDSFNVQDSGVFPPQEPLTKFDSFRSTKDSDYGQGFFPPQDSFTRFDSFRSTKDSDYGQGFFPPQESFTRFDSFSSTKDSDYGQGFFPPQDSFTRFDSFRSTADSDVSHGYFPPRDYARFDSIRSTRDTDDNHGFQSFDDSDPFGSSGLFKTSLDSQTARKESDNWRAF